MLVKLMDTGGTEWWVNPLHVRALKARRSATELYITLSPSFGRMSIKVRGRADDVAALLNAALPEVFAMPPAEDEGGLAAGPAATLPGG